MPTRTGQPGTLARGFGRLVDALAKGNNYNPQTGQYSNVGKGLLARGAQVAGTLLTANPLIGQALGQAGENWVNTGNPLNFAGNDSRIGQLVNALTGGDPPGGVTRQVGLENPGLSIPGLNLNTYNLPAVLATGGNDGQPSLGTSNLFNSGSTGNFGTAGPRGFGRAAGSFTPAGASIVDVANSGWGGQQAALGFGIGASSGRNQPAPNLIAKYLR